MIDEYGEILVPELKHYFGLDLRELFSDDLALSPAYVLIHIKWLPMESAFVAEHRGGRQFRGWDEGRYQTVALINAIRVLTHLFVVANSDPKKRNPPLPEPWPVPDAVSKTKPKDKPGSFGFIARDLAAKGKRRKEVAGV